MKTDVEIAQSSQGLPIREVAQKIGISEDFLEFYGSDKAKLKSTISTQLTNRPSGNLILVTAMTPTKAGEGKSTTTVGLVDGLAALNQKVMGCLREPSLGPVFGVKGGATGGGYAQVIPMVDINLHFTGDMHAITAANNLVSAVIDNHLYQGNQLNINPNQILWRRCMDMNDRALRTVQVSLEGKKSIAREDHFNITVASPMMAMLCLSKDLQDFKQRVQKSIVAFTYNQKPITIQDLGCAGSVTVLMKDAIKPNLVQTLEGNPVLIHGGPFANIAHGSNSIIATRTALKLADYVVTEAGFGSDLGAQKFMDITCPAGDFKPNAVVLVVTIRALKMHGGMMYEDLKMENLEALQRGFSNLEQHLRILSNYQVPVIVALNRFTSDTQAEINAAQLYCRDNAVDFEINESWEKGSKGSIALAQSVVKACSKPSRAVRLFTGDEPIQTKILIIAQRIYGAQAVSYSELALSQLEQIHSLGLDQLNVCIAKTQSSLSDDPKWLGKPTGFTLKVSALHLSVGSDFVVVVAGDMMTMPGLSKDPAACHIDILEDGTVIGLF